MSLDQGGVNFLFREKPMLTNMHHRLLKGMLEFGVCVVPLKLVMIIEDFLR